mmetsp:Transcript_46729/g.123492  ORF Transcript_46729/g.123492 Transcript_46729/m.123492 type:complete len:85 (-) Transcript_46729:195-449(-)
MAPLLATRGSFMVELDDLWLDATLDAAEDERLIPPVAFRGGRNVLDAVLSIWTTSPGGLATLWANDDFPALYGCAALRTCQVFA